MMFSVGTSQPWKNQTEFLVGTGMAGLLLRTAFLPCVFFGLLALLEYVL